VQVNSAVVDSSPSRPIIVQLTENGAAQELQVAAAMAVRSMVVEGVQAAAENPPGHRADAGGGGRL